MSGGSLDYVFRKVEDAADSITHSSGCQSPRHKAFAKHLRLVARALKDVEWVLSGDSSTGDDHAAIDAITTPGEHAVAAREALERAMLDARGVLDELDKNGGAR